MHVLNNAEKMKVERVKRFENGFILDPIVVHPDDKALLLTDLILLLLYISPSCRS
jgi:hypothetical protein